MSALIKPVGMGEQLMYSTVRICFTTKDGRECSGTGFFFRAPVDEKRELQIIITNKHVVQDADKGEFFVHLGQFVDGKLTPTGESAAFEFSNFENEWFMHPDENVDLCAMPFGPLQQHARDNGKEIFRIQLGKNLIPSQSQLEELDAIEDILMVGYPNGLWDQKNNFPLFRRGITASHPAIDFEGESITVVDIACFPGSSGSPVILMNKGMLVEKSGDTRLGSHRVYLLGVLSSGPIYTAQGRVHRQKIPTGKASVIKTELMMHLGYIEKSREIATLSELMVSHLRKEGHL